MPHTRNHRSSFVTSFLAIVVLASTSMADEPLTIGDEAPNLNIEHWIGDGGGDFDHTTKLQQGKVYVIEFWATWCVPCIASMPHRSELQREYADRNVQIFSISDEPLSRVKAFLALDFGDEDGATKAKSNRICSRLGGIRQNSLIPEDAVILALKTRLPTTDVWKL